MKKNIVITILVILVLGLGTYIVTDKVINNKTKKENNVVEKDDNTSKEIEKDYDLKSANELVATYVNSMSTTASSLFKDGLTEDNKKIITMNSIYSSSVYGANCSDIYADDPNAVGDDDGFYKVTRGDWSFYCDPESVQAIDYKNVNEVYHKLFGKSSDMKKEHTPSSLWSYDYDKTNDRFIRLSCRCGVSCLPKDIYAAKTAKETGNKLIVEVGYTTLVAECTEPYDYYSEFDENLRFNTEQLQKNTFNEEFINKYYDKVDKYEFTFVKDGYNYILESIKPVK